jgi:hypothetical protein
MMLLFSLLLFAVIPDAIYEAPVVGYESYLES